MKGSVPRDVEVEVSILPVRSWNGHELAKRRKNVILVTY